MMTRKMRAICAVFPVLALIGCVSLNTRPGHPDSWKTSYYDDDLVKKKWETRSAHFRSGKDAGATPVYQTAKTPGEIWQARGYAFNKHLEYQAAAYKAQDVQDRLAIPLFGAAIATVATGLAKASTVAVAATGLGGASIGAGVSYLHPEKDIATNQAANAALLCVVDQSKILTDMSAIPLVLDKAALQDALNKMRESFGPLLTGAAPNTQNKVAVQAVEAAAESSLKALDKAIAAYVALPGELFMAADLIDQNAQQAGARSLDYASILKSLQTSASNQSATDKAKSDVQNASDAVASSKMPNSSKTGAPATTLTATGNAVSNTLEEPAPDEKQNPGVGKAAVSAVDAKRKALDSVLRNTGISDLTRVNVLAKAALNDIPDPNFSAITANIQGCAASK